MKMLKPVRLLVFFIATIALAKFFEAGRLIANERTFTYLPMSLFSLFAFLFSLFILGYWVYIDEKEKNNLRIKFGPYEWLYRKLTKSVIARNGVTKQSPNVK